MDGIKGKRSGPRRISQPNHQGGESSVDVCDWRNQLLPDSRQRNVDMVRDTLKRHLPYSGLEGLNDLKRIALRFEEKIFSSASSESDYLCRISLKMLSRESKTHAVKQEATTDSTSFNKVEEVIEANDSKLNPSDHLPTSLGGESSINAVDWRNNLLPNSRERIVNKIRDTLERHCPHSGLEGLNELKGIAVSLEEETFSSASSQLDYIRRISLMMLKVESKHQVVIQDMTTNSVPIKKEEEVVKEGDSEPTFSYHMPTPQGEESSIDAVDWRNELLPDSRERIVNKLTDTLERHLPYSGLEGLNELKRIAAKFEEKIFYSASSQSDYLRRISLRMLRVESKDQVVIQDMMTNFVPIKKEEEVIKESHSEPISSHHMPTPQGEESRIDAVHWRNELLPDSRERIVNKITDTLERHLPYSGLEGLNELKQIAAKFEEKIFYSASSQSDYLRRISLRMLRVESKDQVVIQDMMTNFVPVKKEEEVIKVSDSEPISSHHMPTPQGEESSINAVDWRNELLPDSRERIVKKIRDSLFEWRHPDSGPEGLNELKRIATMFEEKIFSSASSQSDYLRRISLKMLSMEPKPQGVMPNFVLFNYVDDGNKPPDSA